MSNSPYVVGVDFGGTKIAAAVFDCNGRRVTDVHSLPTMARQPAKLTLMNLTRVISQAIRSSGFTGNPKAIGMGCPGYSNPTEESVLADHLPALKGFHMGRFINSEFGSSLFMENDANCFALAEAILGAGSGYDIVAGVTIGTGFGCGLIIDGKIYRGHSGRAGEVSHCQTTQGKFDEIFSGEGVRRFYKRAKKIEGDTPSIKKTVPSAKEIGLMAENGDLEALKTWELFGQELGEAIVLITSVFDPGVCVVGGSIARRFSFFQTTLEKSIEKFLPRETRNIPKIKVSRLGNAAGVIGAAKNAFLGISSE